MHHFKPTVDDDVLLVHLGHNMTVHAITALHFMFHYSFILSYISYHVFHCMCANSTCTILHLHSMPLAGAYVYKAKAGKRLHLQYMHAM